MSTVKKYIFVLWAHHFDDALATTLVTVLRRAGFNVKVVGLHGRPTSGQQGLSIVPDLTLSQALPLASHVSCIIFPCSANRLHQLEKEPRLHHLLYRAHENEAKFIVGKVNQVELAELGLFRSIPNITVSPDREEFLLFATEIADELLAPDM